MKRVVPVLTGHKGFRVAGRAARTSGTAEASVSGAKVPALWSEHRAGGGSASIPHAMDPTVSIAVYAEYESDHLGRYTVLVGSPVLADPGEASGVDRLVVPDGSYLLFTAIGSMPVALAETWQAISDYFDERAPYERAYSADFEVHHADDPEHVDVYVSVR